MKQLLSPQYAEPPNKLSFSLSLPTGGGFLQESEPLHSSSPLTSALLLPPNNSPHTRTPGKLKRAGINVHMCVYIICMYICTKFGVEVLSLLCLHLMPSQLSYLSSLVVSKSVLSAVCLNPT